MVNKKAYILGAGMSGLVAGLEFAKKGVEVEIIEKFSIPGGLARTFRFNDYYIDAGPHLFHTSSPEIVDYWKSLFPEEFIYPSLYGKNYVNGIFYDYPLTEETLTQLPKNLQDKIHSEISFAGSNSYRLKEAKSYKDYIIALAGPTLQELFYEEYPNKLWGIPTHELSPNWAPQRIEIRKLKKPFHADQWAAVAKNGCGRIMEIMAEKFLQLGGLISFDNEVEGFEHQDNQINKIITNKKIFELKSQDIIISTLPITKNSNFLNVPCELTFRNIKLVVIITSGPEFFPKDADWLYFKDKDIVFHRAGLQTRFSYHGIPDEWNILCCEIAYSPGDEISLLSDMDLGNKVVSDLEKLQLIDKKSILNIHNMDLGHLYPSYKIGFEKELQKVRAHLEKFTNFYFTGTLADFSYADFQILCAKSIDLVNMIEDSGSAFNHIQRVSKRKNSFNSIIQVGKNIIGHDYPPYIIGEIGLNHNGSVKLAKQLIDICAESGCKAAKFQTFNNERISAKVLDAKYNESILDLEENLSQLFDRLIFTFDELQEIFSYGHSRNLDIFSTPFDIESLEILHKLDVPAYKIASMDISNLPLIKAVAEKMKPIFMSTGMSTLGDIEEAIKIILSTGNQNLVLLHCVSSYPAFPSDSNLKMISTLSSTFKVVTGFSDHFSDIYLIPPAIALGARVIEKHVTIDKMMKGPDHFFSLELSQLKSMNDQALEVFSALGSGVKEILPAEYRTIQKLRRTLFARVDIPIGAVIQKEMLVIKSPGLGMLPKYIDLVIGRVARQEIPADHPITWECI